MGRPREYKRIVRDMNESYTNAVKDMNDAYNRDAEALRRKMRRLSS